MSKVKIKLGQTLHDCKIFIDGKELPNVCSIKIDVDAEHLTAATVEFIPHEIEGDLSIMPGVSITPVFKMKKKK